MEEYGNHDREHLLHLIFKPVIIFVVNMQMTFDYLLKLVDNNC